ncbi:MAG TPA: CHAP domain-containing protein [Novosphingobium sp.]|nr:CHAP domain-containing protein [Novosphingobium sp.]
MRGLIGIAAAALAACVGIAASGPARAAASDDFVLRDEAPPASSDAPYLQCVPYARDVTGIRIFGDAHTWWGQAEGKYARGSTPKVGAAMSFKAFGGSRLGHVAAVSRIIDSRNVLIRHANWSPINGRRGQIEDDVRAVDVSEANDWSEVRVWFAPIQGLGTTHWPLNGFIYPDKPGAENLLPRPTWAKADTPSRIGKDFLKGIAIEKAERRSASRGPLRDDPIGALIAKKS